MTISAAAAESLIARASERVRAGWKPVPPGSYLSTLVTDDQPPLTTGAVDMYLAFYAWLWERETPAEEAARVTEKLVQDSQTAWVRMDWSVRDAVLSTCALFDEIRQRPEGEREEIRSYLQKAVDVGSYPELEARSEPGPSSAGSVEELREQSARTHNQVMDALRNWPDLPH